MERARWFGSLWLARRVPISSHLLYDLVRRITQSPIKFDVTPGDCGGFESAKLTFGQNLCCGATGARLRGDNLPRQAAALEFRQNGQVVEPAPMSFVASHHARDHSSCFEDACGPETNSGCTSELALNVLLGSEGRSTVARDRTAATGPPRHPHPGVERGEFASDVRGISHMGGIKGKDGIKKRE